MSEVNKTHYRKVFKSDHLGQADLEDFIENGSNLVFTIHHVTQEIGARVAGKKINANIAYFQENIKPLVLNATNSKTLKQLTGSSFVEDWSNVTVQLYIDANVKMKGDKVGGVRISPKAVQARQVVTRENVKMWNNAISAYKRDGNFDKVLARVDMMQDDMQFIVDEVASGNL
jgi:pentatricopeptide repeat protein